MHVSMLGPRREGGGGDGLTPRVEILILRYQGLKDI